MNLCVCFAVWLLVIRKCVGARSSAGEAGPVFSISVAFFSTVSGCPLVLLLHNDFTALVHTLRATGLMNVAEKGPNSDNQIFLYLWRDDLFDIVDSIPYQCAI